METWDDNTKPLAYFITFRTYGSWLWGDERGSIDRYHNKFRGPRVPVSRVRQDQHRSKLKSRPSRLNRSQRKTVAASIENVCKHRAWRLLALSVRSNHIHIVVEIGDASPDHALRDFKAYATRALRDAQEWPHSHSPWVDGGSKRFLWKRSSVEGACAYVIYEQGDHIESSF